MKYEGRGAEKGVKGVRGGEVVTRVEEIEEEEEMGVEEEEKLMSLICPCTY